MCVAIYSPIGTPVPCEDYLLNCFTNNPDGSGFAFNLDDRRVQIVKGLMTYDEFIRTFRNYDSQYGFKDRGVLIHFRITTHGGTSRACCHPFPLTEGENALKKTRCVSSYAVIHNGIITLCTREAGERQGMSDTMIFIQRYLSKIASNKRWFANGRNWELIGDLADSKVAILNGRGEIRSTAGFHQAEDGNYYSNKSYRADYGYYGWYGYTDCLDGMPLMMLRKDEFIYYDDGTPEDFDESCPMFLSQDGTVYACFDCGYVGTYVSAERLTCVGTGCFVSKASPLTQSGSVRILPFREDVTVFDMDKTLIL